MKGVLKSRIDEIFITIATSLCVLLLYTPVNDDIGSLFESFAGSQFSDFSFLYFHYLALIAIHPVYSLLYECVPNFNWLGVSFLCLQILGLYLLLRSIKQIVLNHFHTSTNVKRLIQLFFAVVYIGNLCSISHTRSSMLFCGIGLFNLAFKPQLKYRDYLLNGLLFLTGMLYRPEGSLGMLLMISSGFLIHRFTIKALLLRLYIPILILSVLLGVLAFNWANTTIFMEKIEPEIEYKMMDERVVPLSNMVNANDSIKYQLSVKGMWLDPEVITPDFLRSIQLKGVNTNKEHIFSVFKHVLSLYQYYSFVALFLMALLLFGIVIDNNKWGKLLLFNASVFVLLFASDYNGLLITHRHFLNIQLVALLVSMFYIFSNPKQSRITGSPMQKMGNGIILTMLSLGCILTVIHYNNTNVFEVKKTECAMATIASIDQQFKNRTFVVTMAGAFLFNKTFTYKNIRYTNNRYLLYDAFTYSLIPEYSAYLNSVCRCESTNPLAFYRWLSREHGLYLANEERFLLTEKYMQTVHHIPLKFKSANETIHVSCTDNYEYHFIKFKEVTIEP